MILLLGLMLSSCTQDFQSEKEEIIFWDHYVLDAALARLYQDKDTVQSLKYFDSLVGVAPRHSVFPKVRRWIILANYFYFFTTDNAATARMVDSALGVLETPELQNRYPETHVHNLLFGGDIAYRMHRFRKAYNYYFEAKKLGEGNLSPCKQKSFNYSIAMVLYQQQNYGEALEYFRKAFELQNTCLPQTGAVVLQQQEIQSNVGLCLMRLGKLDSALFYFDKAWQLSLKYKDSLGPIAMQKIQGVLYGHKAQVYQAKGALNRAKALCLKSLALNARPGYEVQHAQQVKLQLAEIYEQQRDYGAMFQILQEISSELETLPNPNVAMGLRRLMTIFYGETGQSEQARAMFQRYIGLRDSLDKVQKILSASDVKVQLDAKEKAMSIALLKKDNHITSLFFWIALGSALLVFLVLVLIFRNYQQNKRSLANSLKLIEEIKLQKEARIREAALRHKEITQAVIEAQENERAAIGLELHDNVNQVLTTIKLYLGMALDDKEHTPLLLKKSVGFLQQCIDEIRILSRQLSAPRLGKISLEDSIDDLLNSLNGSAAVYFTKDLSGIAGLTLEKDQYICLYRIVQEHVNNIIKHANATCAHIELALIGSAIHLTITDDGIGFIPKEDSRGIGLNNMSTRAESLNGTFKLESTPGQGCKVHVVIPV